MAKKLKESGKAPEPPAKAGAKNARKAMAWNRDIAVVTFVGILMLITLTGFTGFLLAGISANVQALEQQLAAAHEGAGKQAAPGASDECIYACSLQKSLEGLVLKIAPEFTGETLCSDGGKMHIIAFHSPTCGYCTAQDPVLEELEAEYGGMLVVEKACLAVHQGDEELCAQSPGEWDYLADETAVMAQRYLDRIATPILVFNCGVTRTGSLAAGYGEEAEKTEIKALIDALLA